MRRLGNPMTNRTSEEFVCPVCGADVPVSAVACPECGSDETTGWSEQAEYDGLDLPDSGNADEAAPRTSRRGVAASIVVVVLIIVLLSALTN